MLPPPNPFDTGEGDDSTSISLPPPNNDHDPRAALAPPPPQDLASVCASLNNNIQDRTPGHLLCVGAVLIDNNFWTLFNMCTTLADNIETLAMKCAANEDDIRDLQGHQSDPGTIDNMVQERLSSFDGIVPSLAQLCAFIKQALANQDATSQALLKNINASSEAHYCVAAGMTKQLTDLTHHVKEQTTQLMDLTSKTDRIMDTIASQQDQLTSLATIAALVDSRFVETTALHDCIDSHLDKNDHGIEVS